MIDWSLMIAPETRAAEARAAARAALKTRRDAEIAAGILCEGLPVATDDVSQARLAGAALAALMDPDLRLGWKLPDGRFVTLDGAQVLTLARAVRAHVQACFNREAAALAQLDAG